MRAPLLALCLMIALARSSAGQSASPSSAASPRSTGGNATSEQTAQQPAEQPAGKTKDGAPIYSAGPGIKPPRITYQPEPDYSRQARTKDIRGVVGIEGYVGTDGKFHDARIVRALDPLVDPDALAGVSHWKFKPATKDGKPVNCRIYIELEFHLY